MDSLAINPADARKVDALVALFEAQLREHAIKICHEELRVVIQTAIDDKR